MIVSELTLKTGFSILVGLAIAAGPTLAYYEHLTRSGPPGEKLRRNFKVSLSALGPNTLTYLLLAPWWAFAYFQLAEFAPRSIPVSAGSLIVAFFACDLSYYLEHRCGHKLRLFWRLHHGTHHSSDHYNVPLAYRVNFLNQFTSPVFYLPWLLAGFHPIVVLGFQLFVFHYQAWIHTERVGRLGIFDRFFNTPAVHRMHHSNDPAHTAVNLGGVTLLWDHLLGTYCEPRDDVVYGIHGEPPTTSYAGVYLDPWRWR